jgi:hypothetical protein
MVQLNPRIATAAVPLVIPRHPTAVSVGEVDSTYRYDFSPEVEVMQEEGFSAAALSFQEKNVEEPYTPGSPVPSSQWSRPS